MVIFLLSLLPSYAFADPEPIDTIIKTHSMKEVVINAKKPRYKRKGNPAVELMRQVIEAKGQHDLHANDFAQYHKYQRMTFALNNISQEKVDSMAILKRPLLRRQIEFCPQTGKYILPFAYNETATHHVFRKSPHEERNFILGTNAEGITELMPNGDLVTTALRSILTDVNVCDDAITMLERRFVSPLARHGAISFYHYNIVDTTQIDSIKVIRLSFAPANPRDHGFTGQLSVRADSTRQIVECTLGLPVKSQVNFITNLVIQQRFTPLADGQLVLSSDDLFAELGVIKGHRAFMAHRSTTYSRFSTDSIPDEVFEESDGIREGTSDTKDEVFWSEHRSSSLTHGEHNLSSTTELVQERLKKSVPLYILRTLISNFAETNLNKDQSRFDIGPVLTTVSSNFIDGIRLRVGGQTTARLNPHFFLKGYAAYGTRSRRWYGMAEAEYSFLRKKYSPLEFPRHSIRASIYSDVVSASDLMWTTSRDKDNVFVSFRWQTVDHMMFTRQWSATYELETNNHLGVKLRWKAAELTPCGSLFYRRMDGTDVEHFNTADLTATIRWSPGEELVNSRQRRRYLHHNAPVFTLAHTVGFKGVLGCEYNYNLTELSIEKRYWLHSYGRLDINLRGGIQWNRVPMPLLIMPVANQSYIITRGMFSMIGNMEFINDRYASLGVEWDLSGKLFNRIPLLRELGLREVIGFKALYGHLTERNNPTAPQNLGSDLFEMPSRDGVSIVHPMTSMPYMELNVGIHNIFKILRIDYVRRLNYHLPGVKKNGVRFCIEFNF